MSQKAKKFLRNKVTGQPGGFTISVNDGGYVGSLIGLGFLKRGDALQRGQYFITERGRDWCGLDGSRK